MSHIKLNSVTSRIKRFNLINYPYLSFFMTLVALCAVSLNAYAETTYLAGSLLCGNNSGGSYSCASATTGTSCLASNGLTPTYCYTSATTDYYAVSGQLCSSPYLRPCSGTVSTSAVCPAGSELAGQTIPDTSGNRCNPLCRRNAQTSQIVTGDYHNGSLFTNQGCEVYIFGCTGTLPNVVCHTCTDGLGAFNASVSSWLQKGSVFVTPPTSCNNYSTTGDPSVASDVPTTKVCPIGSALSGQTVALTASCQPDAPTTKVCPAGSEKAGQSINYFDSCNPSSVYTNIPNPVNPQPSDSTAPNGSLGSPLAGVPNVNLPSGYQGAGGSGHVESPGDSLSYGGFPALPKSFYDRRYTSLTDLYVVDLQLIEQTPLFSLISQFQMPFGVGQYPSFSFDLTHWCGFDFGVHVFTIPTQIWDVLVLFFELSTYWVCFSIIFL